MRLFQKTKEAWQKMSANMGMKQEYNSVFDLPGVPAFNQFYNFGIFVWKCLYRGMYTPWHIIPAPTIENKNAKRELYRMDLSKAACAELAGMIWSEQCDIAVTRTGWEPTEAEPEDVLDRFVMDVLRENNFWSKMQEAVEQSLALGGEALKVWFEPKKPKTDRNGRAVVDEDGYAIMDGKIKIGYCMADQFVPTAWDNAGVSEGIFISRKAKDGYYYTRLERHKWDGDTYVITNELYRAQIKKDGYRDSQDILGVSYPLAVIYPELSERTELRGVGKSLFSYFKTPIANNIDDNSPLGISIYANALGTLHALDICYDSFVREFRLGKKRIIVPARCVNTVIDPETGEPRRYFDASDETYEALSTEDPDALRIQDNSVALRVEEHVAAINAFLAILCLQLGFSASTFTFDMKTGLKTATEVVSENSKTYKTIKNNQTPLREAIERMVDNIIAVAALYGVEYEGQQISALAANGYNISIQFDDSVIQDRTTNINEGILLTSNGLMSKRRFLTDPKFGQGLTPEQAEAELRAIAEEKAPDSLVIDSFFASDGE